ncbi:MAG: sulfatase family protein [Opitutales bacterium]
MISKTFLKLTACLFICSSALQAAPNFLIITADDMNWDSVGAYGCTLPDTTPNIDRLAQEGILYDQAHVASTACMPSRNAINTGRFPHRSGGEGFQHLRFPDVPTIPAVLHEAGYFVGILGKVNHSTPYKDTPWDFAEEIGRNTEQFYTKSKGVIETAQAAGKPFYLIVNSHDPHRPYFKHQNKDKAPVPRNGKAPNSIPSRVFMPDEVPVPEDFPDHPEIRYELADYFSTVRRCDDVVGRMMDLVNDLGIADNTIVMFLSDHGMATPTAKSNAYQDSTRTPFIIRWPGKTPAGMVYDKSFVSALDIFPTLLDAADIPNPGDMDGVSLLPTFQGEALPERDTWVTAYYASIARNQFNMRTRLDGRYSYTFNPFYTGEPTYRSSALGGRVFRTMYEVGKTDPEWKARAEFIVTRTPEELYDLEKDPKGLNNLIDNPEYAELIEENRKAMRAWMVKTEDPIVQTFDAYTEDFSPDSLIETYSSNLAESGMIGKAPRTFDPSKSKKDRKKKK